MTQTDAERAYREIKEQIIKTKLPPGSVISIAERSGALHYGRTPIREALKQLQLEDLVDFRSHRGILVAGLSITDLSKIVEVRIELEGLAARLSARRITPDRLEKLTALVDRYRESHPSEKEQLLLLDRKFHRLIAGATRNRFLQTNLEHYYDLSLRIWYMALPQIAPEDITVADHVKIKKAISSGDARQAEQIIVQHVRDFHTTIKKYL